MNETDNPEIWMQVLRDMIEVDPRVRALGELHSVEMKRLKESLLNEYFRKIPDGF